MPSSKGSSQPRDRTLVPRLADSHHLSHQGHPVIGRKCMHVFQDAQVYPIGLYIRLCQHRDILITVSAYVAF